MDNQSKRRWPKAICFVAGHATTAAVGHWCRSNGVNSIQRMRLRLSALKLSPGVARHQIGAGELEVDGRLPERLVFGVANPARGFRIPHFQTVLFLQQPIFQEEDSIVPPKHQIPRFHLVSLPLAEDTERGISRVSGYWASARTVRPESEPPVNLLEILLEFASVSFVSH